MATALASGSCELPQVPNIVAWPLSAASGLKVSSLCPPVHRVLVVQVLQSTQNLGRIEKGTLLLEARGAHVVDVELEVTPIHDGQDQAQRILGLVGIGQADLGTW